MQRRASDFFRYWLPPALWAAAIFIQSSFRALPHPELGFRVSDKVAHAVVYAALAWLVLRALRGAQGMPLSRAAWWAFCAAVLYGATDELHQGLVPSRSMDWGDWIADAAGAATVFLAPAAGRLPLRFRKTGGGAGR